MNDTFYRGIVAGILGGLGDEIIHVLGHFLFGLSMTEHYVSQLIFPAADLTMVRFLFAFLIHFITAALMGVILSWILKVSGNDFPYLKALGFGGFLFITHVGVIPNIVSPRPFLFRSELEMLFDLMAHAVFSILAATYLIFAYHRSVVK